ncbi:MAG: T9SS type A sorting domain-containing protein [Bacteroidetes bacterium]|nr:T9SS type A sorting domain-containing protein [Bacteroidota bacterium]
MKKQVFSLFILLSFLSSHGQQALSAGGGEATDVGGTVSFTVGQVAYEYKSDTGGSVSEGVQQTYDMLVCVLQQINVLAGWSIISSYIIPDAPDMLEVIQAVESDIVLLKDAGGSVVFPQINLNLIGDWNVTEGYKVKAINPFTLELGCTQVNPATTPISLSSGWSFISFLRTDPMDAANALSSINDSIIIVKNGSGAIYLPSLGLNQIGDMIPGEGYQIKMLNEATLIYPANTARIGESSYTPGAASQLYSIDENTGNNSTIVIPDGSIEGLEADDEIGIFSRNGELTGSGLYDGHHMAITVWGNDVTLSDENNMIEGEPYRYKVYRPSTEQEFDLLVEYGSGSENFTSNGISILKKGIVLDQHQEDVTLNESELLSIYPNPASNILNAAMRHWESSKAYIEIFDLHGRLVMSPFIHVFDEGHSVLEIDISSLAKGNYIYRLETPEALFHRKFVKQ